jgi:DegV family protein with EDD domain
MKPKNISSTVITGSPAQIPTDIAADLGIEVLPFFIHVEGKEYLDGVTITPGEFYQKMRTTNLEARTAAPSVGQYYQLFERTLEVGTQEILCITLSNKLSSDYSSAVVAAEQIEAEFPNHRVVVFDSLSVAVPQGLLAIEAARRLNVGEPLDKVLEYITVARKRTGFIAALDSLDYLARGGRIGKAAYLVGSRLSILPIITINDEGVISPAQILRKKEGVLTSILSLLTKKTSDYRTLQVAVMHADEMEQAKKLRQLLMDALPGLEISFDEFTPVMGVHTGPGLIGLGYLYE